MKKYIELFVHNIGFVHAVHTCCLFNESYRSFEIKYPDFPL